MFRLKVLFPSTLVLQQPQTTKVTRKEKREWVSRVFIVNDENGIEKNDFDNELRNIRGNHIYNCKVNFLQDTGI